MERLLCWAVAVKLRTESFPPSGGVDTAGVPTSILGGIVCQLKKAPLTRVAQEKLAILPSLIFLDSGVVVNIITPALPTW